MGVSARKVCFGNRKGRSSGSVSWGEKEGMTKGGRGHQGLGERQ